MAADGKPPVPVLPRTPSMRLDGRRALVAGASSGIGLGAAMALAEAGAHVVLAARSLDRLEDIVRAMRGDRLSAAAMRLDVADIEESQALVAEAGPFDILVNSAGLARHGPARETTAHDFDLVFGTNVRGAYFLTRAVARGLLDAGRPGSLINISSQMGHVGGVDRAVYCATKHAVEGFTKAMAIEWGSSGIRVNTISPTFVETPLTHETFADPERARWIAEKIKVGRVGHVEDIMAAVLYLAGNASAMVTGTSLRVDGGWTAG
jgi:NAD(P)-dependent dehydrogenase (short-subunit alcohol dehydrogenase family)